MWPLTVREVLEGCGIRCVPGSGAPEELAGETPVGGATGSPSDIEPGDLFVALPFADGDAHAHVEEALLAGAALALVSEGWPRLRELPASRRARCVAVPDVTAAFRRLAAVMRGRLPCPVAAIAGCNGKTTTKDMLAALLSSRGRRVVRTPGTDNGFLGLPRTLCSRELAAGAVVDAVVLEIGIDATGAMEQHARMIAPDVAVVTALGPEHLGGLGDVATAVREELALLTTSPGARRVLPLDDPEIAARPWLLRAGDAAVVQGASLSTGALALPEGVAVLLFQPRLSGAHSVVELAYHAGGERGSPARRFEMECPLPGAHNARNLALAAAAALLLGRSPEEIREGLTAFEPPPFRSAIVALARGALLYDDCFNASPLSMAAALSALGDPSWAGRPKVAVLGDMLDLGGESERWHVDVAERVCAVEGLRVCLFGVAMRAVSRRLSELGEEERVIGALESGDPARLVAGVDLPERAVVLVKGSRGMRLERVVHYLELRWAQDPAAAREAAARWVTMVAVAGGGRGAAARSAASALEPFGPVARVGETGIFVGEERISERPPGGGMSEVLFRAAAAGARYGVVSLGYGEVLSAAADGCFDVVVFTGLSGEGAPPGADAETLLAHVAQLVVRGRGPRALVLSASDPGCDLLAEVAPATTRVVRYGSGARGADPRREEGSGGEDGAASLAAAAVVRALGGGT